MFLFGSKGFKPVGFRYWGVMGSSLFNKDKQESVTKLNFLQFTAE